MKIVDPVKQRKADLAAIHVGKKALNLDDETYRTMLWTVARVRSAADLDHKGRADVLEHMRRRGFARKDEAPAAAPATPAGKKPEVSADKQALIDAIERRLGSRPWNYARAMAMRMFKLQLEWCGPDQLHRLVAALEYDRQRKAKGTR